MLPGRCRLLPLLPAPRLPLRLPRELPRTEPVSLPSVSAPFLIAAARRRIVHDASSAQSPGRTSNASPKSEIAAAAAQALPWFWFILEP